MTEEVWEDADGPDQGDAQGATASAGSGPLPATPSQAKAVAEGGAKAKQGAWGSPACLVVQLHVHGSAGLQNHVCQMLVVPGAWNSKQVP